MEFDEISMIWNAQKSESIYGFNEAALHNRIRTKERQGLRITEISELLGIVAYLVTAIVVFAVTFFKPHGNIFMYVLASWLACCAIYVLLKRGKRTRAERQFDRSMRGDLQHAISVAGYQVRLSYLMRWNVLPIGMLTVLSLRDDGKSLWIVAGLTIFFLLTIYASGWEHNIYKSRKKELEVLRDKLGADS